MHTKNAHGSITQEAGGFPVSFYIIAATVLLLLYLIGLGGYPLTDPDEPVYGQVAKEMALGAGWLTPHYAGKPWFDKPPLYYWLSGISALVVGPNSELAARLPSAILGAGLVLLVMAMTARYLGRRAGILSAIVMATCIQQIILAHAAVTDMTFVFMLTAALYGYIRWLGSEGKTRFAWAAFLGVMTGLAALTKGPVALVLLSAAFFVHLWWTGKIKRLGSLDAACAVIVTLLVALPWYAAMYVIHKDAFVEGFLVANNITRFLEPEHADQTGSWTSLFRNIPVLLLFFFPWSLFLLQVIRSKWRESEFLKLCIVWSAVVFIFFSVSKTQLVTYIFPMYPTAAILVGGMIAEASSKNSKSNKGVYTGFKLAAILSVIIAAALVIITHKQFPRAETISQVMGLTLVLASVSSVLWMRKDQWQRVNTAVYILGAGMTVFMLELVVFAAPIISQQVSTRDIIKKIPHSPAIVMAEYNTKKPSIVFYGGNLPVEVHTLPQAQQLLIEPKPVFLMCKKKVVNGLLVAGSEKVFEAGKYAVIANRPAVMLKEYNDAEQP